MPVVEDARKVRNRCFQSHRIDALSHRRAHRFAEVAWIVPQGHQQIPLIHNAHDLSVIEHRQLRNIVELQARVGGHQLVIRTDGNSGVFIVSARNQVAQVAERIPLEKSLIDQPVVIENLRQIFVAAVADETYHPFGRSLLPAVTQRRRYQGAGRRSSQNAFPAEQVARRAAGFLVADRIRLLHSRQIRDWRNEILTDAFHDPASGFAVFSGMNIVRKHRAHRVSQHQFRVR